MKQKAHRDVFAQIKDRVSIVDVFTTYGITINRHNKALCPFHNEKTPSMMVYPDTNSFYCYGCGVGGDSVTLIDKLFHLEPLEAAKKLDADFSLQLFNHQLSEAEQIAQAKAIEQRKQNQHVVTQFKQWERTYYGYLCNQIKLLENLIEIRCPTIQNPVITDDFAQSINRKQILEYHCDILSNGALDEKIALYAEVNKEVNNDKRIS